MHINGIFCDLAKVCDCVNHKIVTETEILRYTRFNF